jgi:hypothetical protein
MAHRLAQRLLNTRITPHGAIMKRTLLPLLGLVVVALTQSGCFTLIAATACAASKGKSCGETIAAGVTADAIIADVVAESTAEARAYEMQSCWDEAAAHGDDPELACGD